MDDFRLILCSKGFHSWGEWKKEVISENIVSTHGRAGEVKHCISCDAGIWRFMDTKEITFVDLDIEKRHGPIFDITRFKLPQYL